MATHDYVIANGTGAAVRADLNNALAAIVSNNSGSSEPGTTYAYQWWADTTNNLLKLRNSANNAWITLRELDGTLLMEDGSNSAPGLSFASDTNTGFFSGGADKIGFATGGAERLEIGSSEVVFNDPSNDVDFRVESNSNTHRLFVDAANDRVGIGTSGPKEVIDARGAAVFSGDHVTTQSAFGTAHGIMLSSTSNLASIKAVSNGSNNVAIQFIPLSSGSGSEAMRIDSSGRLLINHSADTSPAGYQAKLQLCDTNYQGSTISLRRDQSGNSNGAALVFTKSRSGSKGGNTIVADDDFIGEIRFFAADGTDANSQTAAMRAEIDGTPGSNDVPGRLTFHTAADGANDTTERLRIDSSGRVGIGTTSPTHELTVHGATATSGTIEANRFSVRDNFGNPPGLGNGFYSPGANNLAFATNSTEGMRIDGSQRLLIGTSSAASTTAGNILQSIHSSGSSLILGRNDTSVGDGELIGGVRFFANDPSGYNQVAAIVCDSEGSHNSGDYPTRLEFYTTADGEGSPTQRLRIKNDGVSEFESSSHVVTATTSAGAGTSKYLYRGAHSSGSTIVFNVWSNGNVESATNSYGGISDVKLKENIVDANSQWDDLKAIRVRKYNFKESTGHDTHTQIGLVAQEVETVSPGLVTDLADNDADGNQTDTVTKSVNYSVLYMKAVKALQEAMDRIETLETKVAALEAG